MDGILLIDKSEGITSTEVVRVVKRGLSGKRVGHLGTLDPFASGLLPLCVGDGTKIAQFLMTEQKKYTGTIHLGIETDTLDATGTVLRQVAVSCYEPERLKEVERQFSGEYWQTPPMYSAIKKNGVPLYKLARSGVSVKREPRRVLIEELRLIRAADNTLHFSLTCSKGTYVRALAADIGEALGCGAHLATLRRTAFGTFTVDEAVPFPLLEEKLKEKTIPLLSLSRALSCYRSVVLPVEAVARLRHGQQEVLRAIPEATYEQEIVKLLAPEGEVVALAELRQGRWQLVRVL